MTKKLIVKVYKVDLEFSYLNILLKKFYVDLRIFMEYIDLKEVV
jgi:hypothetical protein